MFTPIPRKQLHYRQTMCTKDDEVYCLLTWWGAILDVVAWGYICYTLTPKMKSDMLQNKFQMPLASRGRKKSDCKDILIRKLCCITKYLTCYMIIMISHTSSGYFRFMHFLGSIRDSRRWAVYHCDLWCCATCSIRRPV